MNMHLRCGRIDPHEPHDWSLPEYPWNSRTYHCTGHIIVAGAERVWDDQDDAAEERADREKRETA